MKDLIKSQDEEFNKKFNNIAIVESWGMQLCKCGKEPCECEKIVKNFISKVRKETAECVIDKIEKNRKEIKQFDPDRDDYNRGREAGYNYCLDDIKEIKQQILKEIN